jgi:signal transduction histidine kinase
VSLRYVADGTRLTVTDQAQAPAIAEAPSRHPGDGYGLTGMRERAELLGGSLHAAHTPNGFCVELWLPA